MDSCFASAKTACQRLLRGLLALTLPILSGCATVPTESPTTSPSPSATYRVFTPTSTYLPPSPTSGCQPSTMTASDRTPSDLVWDELGNLLFSTWSTAEDRVWYRYSPSTNAIEKIAEAPSRIMPSDLAAMIPELHSPETVTVSPSGREAAYFIQHRPVNATSPGNYEGYVGPTVSNVYVADSREAETYFVAQITGVIAQILWYPDESRILVSFDNSKSPAPAPFVIREFEVRKYAAGKPFHPPSGYPVSFSPDGRFLVFGVEGETWLRDLASGTDVRLPLDARSASIWWSPDSSALATMELIDPPAMQVVIYRLNTGQLDRLDPPINDVYQSAFMNTALSSDFKLLAYAASSHPPGGGPARLGLARLCPELPSSP